MIENNSVTIKFSVEKEEEKRFRVKREKIAELIRTRKLVVVGEVGIEQIWYTDPNGEYRGRFRKETKLKNEKYLHTVKHRFTDVAWVEITSDVPKNIFTDLYNKYLALGCHNVVKKRLNIYEPGSDLVGWIITADYESENDDYFDVEFEVDANANKVSEWKEPEWVKD